MDPDPVYRGEIARVFHNNMDMPECIMEATDEQLFEIKCIAVAILRQMWAEYRVLDCEEAVK